MLSLMQLWEVQFLAGNVERDYSAVAISLETTVEADDNIVITPDCDNDTERVVLRQALKSR